MRGDGGADIGWLMIQKRKKKERKPGKEKGKQI